MSLQSSSPEGVFPWMCAGLAVQAMLHQLLTLPGLDFLGISVFQWLLHNSVGSLEGFHRLLVCWFPLSCQHHQLHGAPQISPQGTTWGDGAGDSARLVLGVPTVPKARQDTEK